MYPRSLLFLALAMQVSNWFFIDRLLSLRCTAVAVGGNWGPCPVPPPTPAGEGRELLRSGGETLSYWNSLWNSTLRTMDGKAS